MSGSPVNAGQFPPSPVCPSSTIVGADSPNLLTDKIGLLPKRPVSLLTTSSPPATRPSDDDDELEYVENPFEERK